MADDRPRVSCDLPEETYPFTLLFYRGPDVVHEIDVPEPGLVDIPALGGITEVKMRFPNGYVGDVPYP